MTNLPLRSIGNLGSQLNDPTFIDLHGIGIHTPLACNPMRSPISWQPDHSTNKSLMSLEDVLVAPTISWSSTIITLGKTFLWLTIPLLFVMSWQPNHSTDRNLVASYHFLIHSTILWYISYHKIRTIWFYHGPRTWNITWNWILWLLGRFIYFEFNPWWEGTFFPTFLVTWGGMQSFLAYDQWPLKDPLGFGFFETMKVINFITSTTFWAIKNALLSWQLCKTWDQKSLQQNICLTLIGK